MELPISQEGEMPIPLNSSYGGVHMNIHHDPTPPQPHPIPPSSTPHPPSNGPTHDHHHHFKKTVKYRECLKNHAATMGGNATDGCGEFMPSGEENTIEALICSACNCHRNFHRKEIEGEQQIIPNPNYDNNSFYHHNVSSRIGRKVFVGHHHKGGGYLGGADALGYHHHTAGGALHMSSRAVPPHQMIMSYNMGSLPSDMSDEQEEGGVRVLPPQLVKKRFRTKFSQEQKEKMLDFAEKVGWKIQKQEEGVVQQFCQEIGVKRRVLKVWMHNNKHSLGKIKNMNINNISQQQETNVAENEV